MKVEIWKQGGTIVGSYVSDSTGMIHTEELLTGPYIVKVVHVPAGYKISSSSTVIDTSMQTTIDLNTRVDINIDFEVSTTGAVKIMSVDADGKALTGAKVTIVSSTGVQIGAYDVGPDGSVIVDNLAPGRYTITEIKTPEGFTVDTEVQQVQIAAGSVANVTIKHSAMSQITINAADTNGSFIPGVKIEVWRLHDSLVNTYVSSSTGPIVTDKLPDGAYVIKIVSIPDGYTRSAQTSVETNVTVQAGVSVNCSLTFSTLGTLKIMSTDESGKALANTTVTITTRDGTFVGEYTTDKNGMVLVNGLAAGTYIVTEKNGPDGCAENPAPQVVEIKAGVQAEVTILHSIKSTIVMSTVDASAGKPIQGVKVEIRLPNEALVGTYTSDVDGVITVEKLTAGTYTIQVISVPDGYTLSDSALDSEGKTTIELRNNLTLTFSFAFKTLGSLKILSTGENGEALANTTVTVTAKNGAAAGAYTTDKNGSILVRDLAAGVYVVTETKAPDGYAENAAPQEVEIKAGVQAEVTLKHSSKSSITISMVDAATGKPIQGVKTEIRLPDGALVGTYTSDINGAVTTEKLAAGRYILQVVSVPNGYTLSTPDSALDAEGKTAIELKNGVAFTLRFAFITAGSMKIVSTGENGEALANTTVAVTTKDGTFIGEYTTDKNGMVLVNGLAAGVYIVTEKKTPDGYAKNSDPQEVEIKAGVQAEVRLTHSSKSSITISTTDISTGRPIQGVKVEIRLLNEALIGTYTSDLDGVITTEKLTAGTYVIQVVSVPDGYTLSASDSALDTEGKTTVVLKSSLMLTFRFAFKTPGSLKIMSLDSAGKAVAGMTAAITTLEGTPVGTYTTTADGSVVVNDLPSGWYIVKETKAPAGYTAAEMAEQRIQINAGMQAAISFTHGQVFGLQVTTTNKQTNGKVPGAVYEVRKMDGTLVGTYNSGAAGLFYVQLEPGWYTVTPVTAPNGFHFTDAAVKNIEVKADSISYFEFFVNEMSSLRIKVIDGDTKKGLYNVRIQLRNKETVIKEFYTDSEGYINLDFSLLSGSYVMEMISAPNKYVVDTLPRNVSTMFGATTEVTWAIYATGGQIQVVVKSADDNAALDKPAGSVLQGAVFEITNPDTYQVVGQMISDANGVAASQALPLGRYIVKMKTAPAYYAVNEAFAAEVRLKVQDDVVRVETTVSSVNLDSNIKLKSNTTIRAGNTMRVDITDAKNASDTRLDNFYLHIKVPTDAARITTLSTGTWNKSVFYSISYKTNMHDYRSLAKNLQSTNVYQYGLSTQSLGLQSGEYVTDVRMEFGTVPAGFALVQKPAYTQYVLASVYNGYKLISRAELGGQYNTVNVSTNHIDPNNAYSSTGAIVIVGGENAGSYGGSGNSAAISGNSGQWSTSTGAWTTTVSSGVPMPAELPKTGY